jgi:hypothetical protein
VLLKSLLKNYFPSPLPRHLSTFSNFQLAGKNQLKYFIVQDFLKVIKNQNLLLSYLISHGQFCFGSIWAADTDSGRSKLAAKK